MRTAGIIGGLGPGTTAEFYMEIIQRARKVYPKTYPRILIHSIPVPFEVEQSIVAYGRGEEEMFPLLSEGVCRLEGSGADFAVIPCNTVHVFHSQLQGAISIPLLNILQETALACRSRGWDRVGVLGTVKTFNDRIYESALEEQGLVPVHLAVEKRDELGQLISRILSERTLPDDRQILIEMLQEMEGKGADGVILGCTDLQLLVNEGDPDLPVSVVDSMRCLADAVVRNLYDDEGGE